MEEDIQSLKGVWKSLTPTEGEPCAYCGLLATDREHVTPRAWIEKCKSLKSSGVDVEIPKEIIVPSCRECNLVASDRIFESFQEKRKYIREKIYKRHKKHITQELWRDEEIDELGGRLRELIFFQNEIAKIYKKRFRKLNHD